LLPLQCPEHRGHIAGIWVWQLCHDGNPPEKRIPLNEKFVKRLGKIKKAAAEKWDPMHFF